MATTAADQINGAVRLIGQLAGVDVEVGSGGQTCGRCSGGLVSLSCRASSGQFGTHTPQPKHFSGSTNARCSWGPETSSISTAS